MIYIYIYIISLHLFSELFTELQLCPQSRITPLIFRMALAVIDSCCLPCVWCAVARFIPATPTFSVFHLPVERLPCAACSASSSSSSEKSLSQRCSQCSGISRRKHPKKKLPKRGGKRFPVFCGSSCKKKRVNIKYSYAKVCVCVRVCVLCCVSRLTSHTGVVLQRPKPGMRNKKWEIQINIQNKKANMHTNTFTRRCGYCFCFSFEWLKNSLDMNWKLMAA